MALSNNAAPPKFGGHTSYVSLPVAANEWIYRGAMVGVNPAGYAKEFVPGDILVGWALDEFRADSTAGAASLRGNLSEPGATTVRVCNYADHIRLPVSGAVRADIGKYVYATDDNTYAFTGNADAKIGKVLDLEASGYVVVEGRSIGDPGVDDGVLGSTLLYLPANGYTFTPTGATAGTSYNRGFIGASALGLGILNITGEDGGVAGEFDNTAEIASATIYTPDIFPVDKGIRYSVELVVSDKGDAAALDTDWGLGTLLTANSIANIDHADMVDLACFHMDGNSDDILAQSDDNTTDVAAVDTTINNDSTTDVYKRFDIIVRPTGAVEFWIARARVLSSSTFAVRSTVNLGAFINMEKTSDDTTAKWLARNLRISGGRSLV